MNPKVTVLMSAYNSQTYLREAMDSILAQTFTDFEFLIIDDGSKDDTLKIIKSYKDKRIRVISRENKGLTYSLNEGIGLAKGEYIARMDDDDLSTPDRLEKEVKFLDEHPKVGLVGSNYTIIEADGKEVVTTNVFTAPADLKITQVCCNQYGHGSIMARKSVLEQCKGYDPSVGHVEDYDLWTRISRVTDIANFEESLYLHRTNPKGITQQNFEAQMQQTYAVRDKAFQHFLKHRWQYKLFFYQPSGQRYRQRKAVLFRDLAYLYAKNSRPFGALCMMAAALVLEPRNRRNYQCVKYILHKPSFNRWNYEFL